MKAALLGSRGPGYIYVLLGGVLEKLLGRYVPPRFLEVGYLELIFLANNLSLRSKFLLRYVSQELKFSQNWQKLGLKMQNFSKNRGL